MTTFQDRPVLILGFRVTGRHGSGRLLAGATRGCVPLDSVAAFRSFRAAVVGGYIQERSNSDP